jgi:ribosomal protein L37E
MSAGSAATAQSTTGHCEHCGAELAEDQEWCLECGAGRARIRRSPDWRIGAAIVVAVIALALAAFAIALINLSDNANRQAASSAAAASARTTTVTTTVRTR